MLGLDDYYKQSGPDEWTESSMERHDLFNFEAKVDYNLEDTTDKKTKYYLDTFFFIPRSLQINQQSYSSDQFFADLNDRIRFKTPQMSVMGLVDDQNDLSPIQTVLRNLRAIEQGKISDELKSNINRETRLLACICKTTLRDQFNYFFHQFYNQNQYVSLFNAVYEYLSRIEELQEKMVKLRKSFMTAHIPEQLRETFNFSDDYISLQIESWVTKALKLFLSKIEPKVKKKMVQIIEREQDHRKQIKSQLIIKKEKQNESFSYWESILKKFVQGVLYLTEKQNDPRSSALEMFYSVAAGLAMFMSLFLGFLLLSNFEENSIPFILVAIVIYMLKDRIKDNVKAISKKAVGVLIPDRKVDIIDSYNDRQIGDYRESMHFLKMKEVPPEVKKIREASNKSIIESKGKPEKVFLYKKVFTLYNDEIGEIHTRHGNIANIMRFNVKELLRYADDPIQFESVWNPVTQEIEQVSIAKVYHLNLIFRLRTSTAKNQENRFYKKVRVVI
ncbi:MAG: hypothetical protein GF364_14580, partial [Candidatus Lokiarchaeota archaeon]|nr:hypothetical protein [Candidatus Lokiarchaeota archaeon]